MNRSHFSHLTSVSLLIIISLTSCQPAPAATPDMSAALTQAFETALAGLQPTATPLPSETPVPPPTAVRTPPALPSTFVASQLNPLDTPHTYIEDTCQYLYDKWNSNNAAPGTIAMVIMFHGITQEKAERVHDVSKQDFKKMMDDLKEQGFEAITAPQLADFLDHNAKIPARSVVLIQDDRHFAENFNEHFRPYWDKWHWPVVNAYIAKDERPDLWAENAALSAEGWVDYEAHGVIHNENMSDNSTDEFITGELQGAITNMQKYFNKTPIAIIWPGGGFRGPPGENGTAIWLSSWFYDQPTRTDHVQLDSACRPARPCPTDLSSRRLCERSPHGVAALLAQSGAIERGCCPHDWE